MTMAEKEQDHRIAMDPKYAEIHAANIQRSQGLAALVMVAGLTAAAALGIYGDIRISGGVLALLGALQVIHRIWQRASPSPRRAPPHRQALVGDQVSVQQPLSDHLRDHVAHLVSGVHLADVVTARELVHVPL